jgi:pimeloyl-ACP methyl ester carboxylesterase
MTKGMDHKVRWDSEEAVMSRQQVRTQKPSKAVRTAALTHPGEVIAVHERVLGGSSAQGRHIEVASGRRMHVIEVGEGPPLVLLHGSGPTALLFLPLLERLSGVRAIAVDRPGFGLSDPVDLPRERYRDAAVECLDSVLDALGLDETALLGNSMGGTWALWYTLAHPERVRRLVLLGAPPLLPGTRVPPPLRVVATPKVGEFLSRKMPSTPKTVVQNMGGMGEKDTIVNYPDQIEALVAAGHDPLASAVSLAELRAAISPLGFRSAMKVQRDELRQLTIPTLLIWGDHDPVGAPDVAQATADAIPGAQLELLPAGHGPWLGHPDRTAALVTNFVR